MDASLLNHDEFTFRLPLENWCAQFEMLNHLARFSRLTLIVMDDDEHKLFTFRDEYLAAAEKEWQFVHLQISTISHPAELLDEITRQFNFIDDVDLPLADRIQHLHAYVLELDKTPILIINNAHDWSVDMLSALFSLLVLENSEEASLRCILFATPPILTLMSSSALKKYRDQHCHLMSISGIYDTGPIDNYRLEAEEGSGFRDRESDMELTNRFENWVRSLPFHWVLGGGVVLLLIIAMLVQLLFRSGHQTYPSYSETAELQKDFIKSEGLAQQRATEEASTETFSALPNAAITEESGQQAEVTQSMNAQEEAAPTSYPVMDNAKLQQFTSAPADFNAIDKKHYTLQLMAVSKESVANDYVNNNRLSPAWVVKTERNGTDLYVVAYGDFDSKADALQGLQSAPQAVKSAKPWPRVVGDIAIKK